MAKRGRPSKSVMKREPNGRASRGILATLEQAARDGRMVETVYVIHQPHRRDSVDPAHPWNESAIGRFLLPLLNGDKDTVPMLFDAADRYFRMYNRWQRAKSVAAAYREGNGWHGAEPTPAEVADRDLRVVILAKSLRRIKDGCCNECGGAIWAGVHDAIIFGDDIQRAFLADTVMAALCKMAIEMGFPLKQHPFAPIAPQRGDRVGS